MADEDPIEYEKKLLASFPALDNKQLPHTIKIPLSQKIKSIKTRDELIVMQKDSPGPYSVGDLLWVKMAGFPHWPAMISRDPETGLFARSSETVGYTYHVQYFAEATRGWTQPGKFWPFEAPQLLVGGKNVLPKQKKKHHEEAISEAIQALRLDPAARVKKLTFNYFLTDPKASLTPKSIKTPGRKRKSPSKNKNSTNDESIYDFDETIDEIEQGDKPELVWSRPREPTPPRESSPPPNKYLNNDDEDKEDELRLRRLSAEDDDNEEDQEEDEVKSENENKDKASEQIADKKPEVGSPIKNNDISTKDKQPKEVRENEGGRCTRRSTVIVRNSSLPLAQSTDVADEDEEPVEESEVEPQQEEKQKKTPNSRERRTKAKPRREMSPINNNNSSSRPLKKIRGGSMVKRPPPPPPDALTSSEDASSTSDLEAPDVRLDKLCNICHEESGTFYFCSGTCLRTMHASCGGSESTNDNSDKFICQECKTGQHPCFICKSVDGDCIKCCHKNCGKYYHLSCINPSSYPACIKSDKTFTCPMHYCLTCYTDQPTPREINCLKPTKRQLLKCLSCPTAFHNDDACTAAGTVVLAGSYVMCPAHRSTKNDKQINVSWCFSCNEGGNLICCESCPAAFHAECIDNPPKNEEQYFCYDCQSRKQLKYGDIIWIKLGAYRWWPAKISHPHTVPENIMNLSHERGDFPVYFFGSHDYYWSHRGRVFTFVEEDGQLKGMSGSSNKKYKIALQEARQEYLQRKIKEDDRREKLKMTEKPRFKLIKQNRPVNDVAQSSVDDIKMASKQRCECKPDGEILCGTDECLNRLMMLECDPGTCPVKDKCRNQRFRKRQYPVCVPFKTENVGWGLRTTQDIKKGDFVIEYVGELIDEAECNRRMEEKMDRGDTTFYFLTIDKDRIIDAGPAANHARFMNHSCQPNCETQKWVVNGQTKVGLFAMYDVPAGTELTFNYNLDCRGNEKMQCRCNSDNCSGYIGLPVKNAKKAAATNAST